MGTTCGVSSQPDLIQNYLNWDKNTAPFETKEGVIEGREEEERERGEWNRNKKICPLQSTVQPTPPCTHDILRHNDQLTSRSHCEGTDASHIPTEYKIFKFFFMENQTQHRKHKWPNIAISQLFTKTHNCHNSRSILQNRTDFFLDIN